MPYFNPKKILLTLVAISVFVLFVGCAKPANQPPTATNVVSPSPSMSPNPSPTDANARKQDPALTKDLTSEKIVLGGEVFLQGDRAFAAILLKKGTDKKAATDLAQKYASTLKSKYPGKKVNVQAVLDGKSIVNIT